MGEAALFHHHGVCGAFRVRRPGEWWRAKDAPSDARGLETFSILTNEPNALCAPVHRRMPVILAREDWARWLGSIDSRIEIITRQPFPADRIESWQVGMDVGNVKNDRPELVGRVDA